MLVPAIDGVIERRILTNYRIDPSALAAVLPAPFRPKLVGGYGIGGVCLIRLGKIRPAWLPAAMGVRSENAAHRFAVEWDAPSGEVEQGVFVPRRDTSSVFNHLLGGRVFPGVHFLADFESSEAADSVSVKLRSKDGNTEMEVRGHVCSELPDSSIFRNLAEASDFFEAGCLGYSATTTPGRFDGLELEIPEWRAEALTVTTAKSSYFDDSTRFPRGSVQFDCALLMRDVPHRWRGREQLRHRVSLSASASRRSLTSG